MRRFSRFLVFSISCLAATLLMSQTVQDNKQIVQDVVQKYWTMEINGGRLTADGWVRANAFFAHAVARPLNFSIAVIYDDSEPWPPEIKQNKAEVIIGIGSVGQIGPDLHFTKTKPGIFFKEGLLLHVIQENPPDKSAASATVPPRWKIEKPGDLIWLNLSTAIRYVSDERDRTTNSAIKQNAARTLTILRKLQANYRQQTQHK